MASSYRTNHAPLKSETDQVPPGVHKLPKQDPAEAASCGS